MRAIQRWDTTLSARLSLPPTNPKWHLAARTAHLGDGSLVFVGLGLVYLSGWLFDNPSLRAMIVILVAVVLTTAVVVFVIKYTLRRQRPRDPRGFVTIAYDKYSFPSGHSARMSCLAVMTLFFNLPFGLILLLLALLVAYTRVVVGVHYLGDVVAGLAIGALVAAGFASGLGLTL